ncbi:hypothetical protein [Fibrobacter intestinalis]|uniref:hypothetical protein n=1 Tax=Fibrobacter intestinalis TaxID=28122 RepID=UPI0023F28626|nr:hypothetical protein [Fibrobacter intestinalis]
MFILFHRRQKQYSHSNKTKKRLMALLKLNVATASFALLGLELVPVNLVRENVEGMLVVQLLLKGTEKACLGVGFWRSVHGKNCKVFSHTLENLAIFSQGRNQFFLIVMQAGRDFKG